MKRYILLVFMLVCLNLLLAQISVEKIDLSNDNPVVTRVAIALSEKAEWSYSVDKDNHLVYISITNSTTANAIVSGLNQNAMIKDVNLSNKPGSGLVVLNLDKPFLIETMTVDNPFKIVVDLFVYKAAYTFQDLLNQAKFYEKSKKWNAANKQYTKMLQQYPKNLDTYYYWGNLLIRQGRIDSAIEKLNLVPQNSQFFGATQKALAKLTGTEPPSTEPVVKEPIAVENALIDSTLAEPDSQVVVVRPPIKKINLPKFNIFNIRNWFSHISFKSFLPGIINWFSRLPIWFWIIVLLILAIIVMIIFDKQRLQKQQGYVRPRKVKITADDKIKQGMIAKLLDHGWHENEIARELLISLKETKLYIKKIKKHK